MELKCGKCNKIFDIDDIILKPMDDTDSNIIEIECPECGQNLGLLDYAFIVE